VSSCKILSLTQKLKPDFLFVMHFSFDVTFLGVSKTYQLFQVCEGQPTKATRMMQAEEAVSRIKV